MELNKMKLATFGTTPGLCTCAMLTVGVAAGKSRSFCYPNVTSDVTGLERYSRCYSLIKYPLPYITTSRHLQILFPFLLRQPEPTTAHRCPLCCRAAEATQPHVLYQNLVTSLQLMVNVTHSVTLSGAGSDQLGAPVRAARFLEFQTNLVNTNF